MVSQPRNLRALENWELLFRCLSNGLTNHDHETALSWPGCLFIKMADEEGFLEVSLRKANSKQFNGSDSLKSQERAQWTFEKPKGLSKYDAVLYVRAFMQKKW